MYPTLTSKPSLSSPFILTDVVTPSYMLLITLTIHSSTPTCLRPHHTTSRGTLSEAFSKSTKAIHNSLLSKELFLDLTHNKNGIPCSFSSTKSKLHLL